MGIYQNLALVIIVVAAAVIFARYIYGHVDQEFLRLARAQEDPEYRAGELARLDSLLKGWPAPPDGFKPAAGPLPDPAAMLPGFLLLTPASLLLGSLLLGGLENAPNWLWYPLVPVTIVGAWIHFAVRRRLGWQRLARRLRQRADLKRLDNDPAGAAEDLTESLRLAPWDDSSWAELADDLMALGKLEPALAAIAKASELDPHYADYRLVETSLALRLKRWGQARKSLRDWRDLIEGRRSAIGGSETEAGAFNEPRLAVYQAALDLAEGEREKIRKYLDQVDWDDPLLDKAKLDPALAEIKKLFPASER